MGGVDAGREVVDEVVFGQPTEAVGSVITCSGADGVVTSAGGLGPWPASAVALGNKVTK
jgi:hypothetical protein